MKTIQRKLVCLLQDISRNVQFENKILKEHSTECIVEFNDLKKYSKLNDYSTHLYISTTEVQILDENCKSYKLLCDIIVSKLKCMDFEKYVGNGVCFFPGSGGGQMNLNKYDLANILIKISAIFDVERAITEFFSWFDKTWTEYKCEIYFSNLNITEPFNYNDEIYFNSIDEPKDFSRSFLPESGTFKFIPNEDEAVEFRRRVVESGTVVNIKCRTGPIFIKNFYSNEEIKRIHESKKYISKFKYNNKIVEFSEKAFCCALSLACNEYINFTIIGRDIGLPILFPALHDPYEPSICQFEANTPISVNQSDLAKACELYEGVYSVLSNENKDLKSVAITRWFKSMAHNSSMEDKFIDLRIALEAIFIPPGNDFGEKAFKLSSICAWYLGKNVDKRKEYFNKVRKFYRKSSNIIHASESKVNNEEFKLLEEIQYICCKSIISVISGRKVSKNIEELILG